MASLAFITKELRVSLKYGAIGLAGLITLIITIRGLILVKEFFFPSELPPPKQEYGKLQKHFNIQKQNIQYRLNTVDGALPVLPDRMNVYKLYQFEPDLLSLESARRTVNSARFTSGPVKISDTIYQWLQSNSGINIQYDIVTKNFTISSNFRDNPELESTNILPSEGVIKNNLNIYLGNLLADISDIDFENSRVTLLELRDKELVKASTLRSARFARVDLKQNSVDETTIIYASPEESNMSFVVSYPKGNSTVVEGTYYHYEPNLDQKSDYTIKTSDQAFADLKTGKANIFNPTNLQSVDITDVEVKYYLDKNTNLYLQPIIVFSGINFTAYVDAIPDELLE